MGLVAPQDAAFLLAESREHPAHVAGLQLYQLPPDAGPTFVSDLYQRLLSYTDLRPLLRRRVRAPVGSVGQLWWSEDADVDLEYHVRLSALPPPHRVRELLALTSRLHGGLLDRHRPLWEFHLIDGLEGGRFATYAKVHHALADGVATSRLLTGVLSEDPDDTAGVPFWAQRTQPASTTTPEPGSRITGGTASCALSRPLKMASGAMGALAEIGRPLAGLAGDMLRGQAGSARLPAPKTMFNTAITGARRFAAQSWDLDRLKKVGAATGGTLNDMVLAMCAGALRRYLLDFGALPDRPLVAAVPVSLTLRSSTTEADGGNAVGAVLCNLATDIADPHRRVETIVASMRSAKEHLAAQSPATIQALGALLVGAPVAMSTLPSVANVAPPLFNLIISNVPGPPRPLYWNGARMQGCYPISIPTDGQALNITVISYAGSLQFGLTGCRRQVPRLQRLLSYLEDSLAELES